MQSITPSYAEHASTPQAEPRRRLAWRGLVVLSLTLVICTRAAVSAAQAVSPSPTNLSAEVDYQAASECPDRAAFEARLRARTQRHAGAPQPIASPLRLVVRVEVRMGEVRGSIELPGSDGSSARRHIKARSCAEALDALALIAALMLEPADAAPSPSLPATPEPERAEAHQPVPAPRVVRPEGVGRTEPMQVPSVPAVRADRSERAAPPAGPRPARTSVDVLGRALVISGVLAALRPGFAVDTMLATKLGARMELGGVAGVRMALPHRERQESGAVDFRWWSGLVALCAGTRVREDALSLSACAASEWGRLGARGRGARNARTADLLWAAVGPAASIAWRLLPRLSLLASAEGLVPLVRDRFWLAEQVVHRVHPLTFRVGLGLACRIW